MDRDGQVTQEARGPARPRTALVLSAGVAAIIGIAFPWWAFNTNSPVVDRWELLTLELWSAETLLGCLLVAFRGRPRAIGSGLLLGVMCAVVGFVVIYAGGFSLASWD